MELLGATNHICSQEFLGGWEGGKRRSLAWYCTWESGTPPPPAPAACFTVRDSVGIGSNFMSVLLVCGWPCSDLPVEPRGADVMFLCSDGLLVGLSSFSNKQVERNGGC